MSYHISKRLDAPFDTVIDNVTARLQEQGFGILTDIDVSATLAAKIGESFRPYRILGACNPTFAHRALLVEDKVGTLLPCNVIVQQLDGEVEISAVDPVVAMRVVDSPELAGLAREVRDRLETAVETA